MNRLQSAPDGLNGQGMIPDNSPSGPLQPHAPTDNPPLPPPHPSPFSLPSRHPATADPTDNARPNNEPGPTPEEADPG
ncbi:hypothetical protein OG698_19160 [Streptomyces sp. NBC_01003]|uniref:hypothetical protein n=1 Tax=Streptomyces sp. NBC_01003 TaxID=2903714 RepID=UPI0038686849|nr:hypothetical protein OG698_19160 [Streptomyces sp. NBC_01003]